MIDDELYLLTTRLDETMMDMQADNITAWLSLSILMADIYRNAPEDTKPKLLEVRDNIMACWEKFRR